MKNTLISSPRHLSDRELLEKVRHLSCQERQATAGLVAHLAELDERQLYLAEGCSSLFTYCTDMLHMSEYAAYRRIRAARAARQFPVVLEKLADGSVHLTAVRLLAEHLTEENHQDLLFQATHKSKREVEQIVARIRPLPAVASSVRKLPSGGTNLILEAPALQLHGGESARLFEAPLQLHGAESAGLNDVGPVSESTPVLSTGIPSQPEDGRFVGSASRKRPDCDGQTATAGRHQAKVLPLAPKLYKVQFTADEETYNLLCQARELLRHQIPIGNPEAVIGLALKVLVEKLARRKIGATTRSRKAAAVRQRSGDAPESALDPAVHGSSCGVASNRKQPASRHIPAEVKRQVWCRDQGRCAFIGRNGHRCGERAMLEFHHVKPFALGGPATIDNIELRCRAHNGYESRLCFGTPAFVRSERTHHQLAPEPLVNVMFAPPPT